MPEGNPHRLPSGQPDSRCLPGRQTDLPPPLITVNDLQAPRHPCFPAPNDQLPTANVHSAAQSVAAAAVTSTAHLCARTAADGVSRYLNHAADRKEG
ncbi:hypothetical protein GCM10010305_60110 [Streptomyces termitum]|uniref:Uncharacterized protein n=1 Tax=Streptomyces termitum TaxID=67368 RepID=A0A918WE49_9ACTN|nr:hypothetical protein GCM10010305_60110 [Streptomyces termitum]